jgi:predicted MFS family arabinose efflux permease
VLALALGASALSTVVFILAPDVGVLLAGRIVSGLSAGLMTGTATAALTELVPASAGRRASLVATAANMGGLGLGALIAGTVVAGVAVGAVFVGSLATANRLAPPGRRGQAVSAYFVACYCGLVIPVVGVGVASQFIGDFRSVLALSILLAVLCVFALASIARALASDLEASR